MNQKEGRLPHNTIIMINTACSKKVTTQPPRHFILYLFYLIDFQENTPPNICLLSKFIVPL